MNNKRTEVEIAIPDFKLYNNYSYKNYTILVQSRLIDQLDISLNTYKQLGLKNNLKVHIGKILSLATSNTSQNVWLYKIRSISITLHKAQIRINWGSQHKARYCESDRKENKQYLWPCWLRQVFPNRTMIAQAWRPTINKFEPHEIKKILYGIWRYYLNKAAGQRRRKVI